MDKRNEGHRTDRECDSQDYTTTGTEFGGWALFQLTLTRGYVTLQDLNSHASSLFHPNHTLVNNSTVKVKGLEEVL